MRAQSVEHAYVALAEVVLRPLESEAARYPTRDENPQLERVLDAEWPERALRKINASALDLCARRAQDLCGIFRQPRRRRLDGEVL